MKKYSIWQRFMIAFLGQVYIEHRKLEGEDEAYPFYAFNCKNHGIVESYPLGNGRLICPKCIENKDEQ